LICLLLQPEFWRSTKIKKKGAVTVKKGQKNKESQIYCSSILEDYNSILLLESILRIDSLAIHKEVSYFMLLEIATSLVNTSFDTYKDTVLKGAFYEALQDAFEQQLGYRVKDRKEVKAAVFQVLFTPNQFYGQKQAAPKRLFAQQYPELYGVLKAIKKKDPKLLPRLLQQIESHVILKVVAKRMQKLHPNVPIFTIHDSIVTTASNQLLVEQLMQDAFTSCIGSAPTLVAELLAPEYAEANLQQLRAKAEVRSA